MRSPQKKKSVPDQESAGKPVVLPWGRILLLAFCLLGAFILHLSVFSELPLQLGISSRDLFLQTLALRSWKLSVLLGLSILILFLLVKLLSNKYAGWVLNTFAWLFVFLYTAELYLSVFPCSQGNGEAYVSRIWFQKYWQRNAYGFRDRQYVLPDLSDRDILLYSGDSYAAGHGIQDPADRTSDRLQAALGDSIFLVNAGHNGAGTRREYELLRQFPYKPSWVVLTHAVNDIEDIIPASVTYAKIYRAADSGWVQGLYRMSRNSISLDLLYHFIKTLQFGFRARQEVRKDPRSTMLEYNWYRDSAAFHAHLADLRLFSDYVIDSLGARMILVTYPECVDMVIDSTDLYVNRRVIGALTGKEGLYLLNTTGIMKSFPESKRRVNIFDGHPGVAVNRIVADSLVQIIRRAENE